MAKKACKRSSLEIYGRMYFVDYDKILKKRKKEKKKEATLFLDNLLDQNSFLDIPSE